MISNVSSPLETLLFKHSQGLAQFLQSDERLLDALNDANQRDTGASVH